MQFGFIGTGDIRKARAQALILTQGCRLSTVADRGEKCAVPLTDPF